VIAQILATPQASAEQIPEHGTEGINNIPEVRPLMLVFRKGGPGRFQTLFAGLGPQQLAYIIIQAFNMQLFSSFLFCTACLQTRQVLLQKMNHCNLLFSAWL
jgi:hypothetical protein